MINVLSVCDGMAGARIALDKLGFTPVNYYASEIDKYTIKVALDNYPDITQLGDINEISEGELKELPAIDLVVAGTPCINLSRVVAGRDSFATGLEGEYSSLFFRFADVLNWIKKNNNPEVNFLLENVTGMTDEDKKIITDILGVESREINSRVFSAQDRSRYYWTNLEPIPLPVESDEVLGDIMMSKEEVDVLEENSRMNFWYDESFTLHKGQRVVAILDINGHDILKRVYDPSYKSPTLTGCTGGNHQKKVLQEGKPRKLTPVEYERLQTVPDGYTEAVSNTRRYDMLGSGFTVDVICHLLKPLKGVI